MSIVFRLMIAALALYASTRAQETCPCFADPRECIRLTPVDPQDSTTCQATRSPCTACVCDMAGDLLCEVVERHVYVTSRNASYNSRPDWIPCESRRTLLALCPTSSPTAPPLPPAIQESPTPHNAPTWSWTELPVPTPTTLTPLPTPSPSSTPTTGPPEATPTQSWTELPVPTPTTTVTLTQFPTPTSPPSIQAPTPTPPLSSPCRVLGDIMAQLNLLVTGRSSHSNPCDLIFSASEIEGLVAVDGNACLGSGVGIAQRIPTCGNDSVPGTIVASGYLIWDDGAGSPDGFKLVYDVHDQKSDVHVRVTDDCVEDFDGQIDFDIVVDEVIRKNIELCGKMDTARAEITYGVLRIDVASAPGDGPIIVSVDADETKKIRGWELVPPGTARPVLLNIRSSSSQAAQLTGGFNFNPSSTVFNFCGVRDLDIFSARVPGAVLGPLTNIKAESGAIEGSVVAGSFKGNAELYNVPTVVCVE